MVETVQGGMTLSPRELERQRLESLYRGGLTERQKEDFEAAERERLDKGAPRLDRLGLSNRAYNTVRRFGVLTVEGVSEVLEKGIKPHGMGKGMRTEIERAYRTYQQRQTI